MRLDDRQRIGDPATMDAPSPRTVRLVVMDDGQVVRGVTRRYFAAATPWWPEAAPVVDIARTELGLDVVVLRLLEARSDRAAGGDVTYLVESLGPVTEATVANDLEPWDGALDDQPLRQAWARPGGPQRDLAWATTVLADLGRRASGSPQQIRSWNLSSLWRLPTADGDVWLKHVPPFFAHEGAILARLQGAPVPTLIAHDDGRILMPAISGEDLYDASVPVLESLVRRLVDIQAAWLGRPDELLAAGLPDWRPAPLSAAIADVVRRHGDGLTAERRATLRRFVAELPARFEALAATGIPDTIVHGDAHPGNARGVPTDPETVTILDWGDCGVGHPLLDQPAFLDRVPPAAAGHLQGLWHDAWRAAVPGADPDRAARLIEPIAAARQAVIYRTFLDGIEPSEHPYHRGDPERWLERTADIVERAPLLG
jgi:hypothetical protein